MKDPTKTEIRAHLANLQAARDNLVKIERESQAVEEAAANCAATIKKLGEPSYDDDAAIEVLAKAKLKLECIERSSAKIEEALAVAGDELIGALEEASRICQDVLRDPLERWIGKIAAVLRPFYFDDARACLAAQATDVGAAARRRVWTLNVGLVPSSFRGLTAIKAHAERFISILTEAGKAKPDFTTFFQADQQTEADTSEDTARSTALAE